MGPMTIWDAKPAPGDRVQFPDRSWHRVTTVDGSGRVSVDEGSPQVLDPDARVIGIRRSSRRHWDGYVELYGQIASAQMEMEQDDDSHSSFPDMIDFQRMAVRLVGATHPRWADQLAKEWLPPLRDHATGLGIRSAPWINDLEWV